MKIKNLFQLTVTLGLIIILSACSSAKLEQNVWKPAEVKLDGNPSEWKGHLKQVGDQKIWLATANDEKYFYMCLVIEDRAKVMQMMRAGFITWFIPDNNDEATFGIKFPLSQKAFSKEQMQNMNREMFQPENIEKFAAMSLEKQKEFQVINKEKYSLTLLPLENKDGIKARLGYTEGKFVYELQVPLTVHDDYSYQIAAVPGENIKIKFETEQMDLSEMKPGGTGRREGGEIPGMGGGQRSGGMRTGGGMGGGRLSMPEPFNYSVNLKLALPKQN